MEDLNSLIAELSAPVKAFRVFAIEKAIRSGDSTDLLKALQSRRQFEDDDECMMLLNHAISSVEERQARKTTGKDNAKPKITPADFARMKADEQLEALRKTAVSTFKKDGGTKAIQILWQTSVKAVVKAEIVRKCSAFWPDELADLLETSLSDDSSVLQIASLEAIISRFPDRLQKNFDRLVMSPDPIIRATAIRGLARRHPQSAAVFLAESLKKGDYYTRLAALRAISVMPFNLNKSSLIELLGREKDERLLKIIAAIMLSNPDREVPFRICDIIEKAPPARQSFLQDLQKNCCAMIRMAEICPDHNQYLATLRKYPNRIKARHFVQSCINTYESGDQATRNELVILLREKMLIAEVSEAVKTMLSSSDGSELLRLASEKPKVSETTIERSRSGDEPADLLKKLLRIRTVGEEGSDKILESVFNSGKAGATIVPAAFRAAITCRNDRWCEKARQSLRSDNEDLVAASLEYLATFDSDSFMLQIRKFINSPSLIIRTALLRSLCRQSPESAYQLLSSMLADKDTRVREKAIGSLIHFEFSSIRDLLPPFLERENNMEMLNACLSFYLTNPVMESTFDLSRLSVTRPEMQSVFSKTCTALRETLVEFNIASEEEISSYMERQHQLAAESDKNKEEGLEKARLANLASTVKWNRSNISASIRDLSEFYPLMKRLFLGAMLLLALFFFLSGSDDDTVPSAIEGYTPIASQVTQFQLRVQRLNSSDGSITAITADNKSIMALPRPGKAFVANPGDQIVIRALPFRTLPDQTLVVKTIEVINSR